MNMKKGVTFVGIKPETVLAMMVAKGVWERSGYTYTATSITDGKHSEGSLHYDGYAFDSRTWIDGNGTQMPIDLKNRIADELQRQLGDDWDVVVEPTHIHVELEAAKRWR